jgi:carboxyl-terminal processing protease
MSLRHSLTEPGFNFIQQPRPRVMLKRLSAVFVLAALIIYSAPRSFLLAFTKPATPSSLVSTATRAGRLEVFDDTWATINEHYYDSRFRGLNWDAQRVAFRNEAAEAGSSRELYAVLRRMIGTLNDPHTRVFSPEDKFDWWHPRFITIGLGIREIDGLATVVKVEPKSGPARAGIRPGDVIDSVDGQLASAAVNQRLTSAIPNVAQKAHAFASMLDGPAETWLELGWKDKRGQQRHTRFQRYWQQRELGLSLNRESGKYLIIEIDAFTRPIAASFAHILKEKLKRTRGVIIDLRNNGGGDAEAMSEMASSFLGAGVSLGEFSDRSGAGFGVFTSFLTAQPVAINVPVVVLTSERTASAAEIFVAAVKKARRTTIIGTQTCGCVLAIRTRHNLPDGGVLDVSELDYKTPAGERLEGNGIHPDQAVMVNRKDLYAKHDAALAYALSELAQFQNQAHR